MTEPPTREAIEEYAKAHTRPEPELLQKLIEETREKFGPGMLTGRVEGRFLKFLVQMSKAKIVLEVGTFTGYSALSMAEGLPDGGQLITCEINEDHARFADKYFKQSPHNSKILICMGDAFETIDLLRAEQRAQ